MTPIIEDSDRDTIMYIIGKIDGVIAANCGLDASEIKAILEPIRNDLRSIVEEEVF